MDIKQDRTDKKVREKSALYPAVTISDSYNFIKLIDSLGGKSVSYASVLDSMGLSSPTTKSFLNRISASKQFGFITTGGNTVKLTDFAKRILYPTTGESESHKLLIEAFSNPPLYAQLIKRFENKTIPPQTQLSNLLMNEYRIIKQVKDKAAKCFIESANYLGLLDNNILCINPEQKIDVQNEEQKINSDHCENTQKPIDESNQQTNGYMFEIPTISKKNVQIFIPDKVTEKDIDYIKFYIEKMLPIFLENLKTEI